MSRFLPASSRTTFRPPSVSSLTAHEPAAPEPTTIASYVDSLLLIRVLPRSPLGAAIASIAPPAVTRRRVFRGMPPSLQALAGAGLYSTAGVSRIDCS